MESRIEKLARALCRLQGDDPNEADKTYGLRWMSYVDDAMKFAKTFDVLSDHAPSKAS